MCGVCAVGVMCVCCVWGMCGVCAEGWFGLDWFGLALQNEGGAQGLVNVRQMLSQTELLVSNLALGLW